MINNDNHSDNTEKMQRCKSYMEALEEERRKIRVFERELPLCLELVTQAIEGCRQQLSGEYFHGQSECSEQTSSDGPVLEEFIPIKRASSSDNDQEQPESHKTRSISDKSNKKSDWLRSVQLWNQTPESDALTKEDSPRKVSVVEVKRNGGGAFHPFRREKSVGTPSPASVGRSPPSSAAPPAAAASSSAETGCSTGGGGSGSKAEDKDGQRKARRCWSPELHRRFLHALQQLGGAHVATPKQIRELMKVDGLTNDEVKSHLQKYRLHTRRPSPSIHNNNNTQAPQFVVMGGIWMPPPEYAAMASTTASGEQSPPNEIYAPKAALPTSLPESPASRNQSQQPKKLHSEERGTHSEGRVHPTSPVSSSSTRTTTASPTC